MDIGLATLQKMESGKPVDIKSVQWLADNAGVSYDSLMPAVPQSAGITHAALHFANTDDPQLIPALMDRLAELIRKRHEIYIIAIAPDHSLMVEAAFHDDDMVATVNEFAYGQFAELGVDAITVYGIPFGLPEPFVPREPVQGKPLPHPVSPDGAIRSMRQQEDYQDRYKVYYAILALHQEGRLEVFINADGAWILKATVPVSVPVA